MHSIAATLIAFTAAAGVLTLTPGLDSALVLRTAATSGARHAALTALGCAIPGLDRLTGGVFIGFGIGLALESRRP